MSADQPPPAAWRRRPRVATGHSVCMHLLRCAFTRDGIDVTVSAWPPVVVGPYTRPGWVCPHGVTYWAEPTGEQIAAWIREGVQ